MFRPPKEFPYPTLNAIHKRAEKIKTIPIRVQLAVANNKGRTNRSSMARIR